MENCIGLARKARGKTQQELADALGVTVVTISRWETDETYIRADNLCKIADYLNVSTDQLCGRKALVASK